jgi:hypothetical protein
MIYMLSFSLEILHLGLASVGAVGHLGRLIALHCLGRGVLGHIDVVRVDRGANLLSRVTSLRVGDARSREEEGDEKSACEQRLESSH